MDPFPSVASNENRQGRVLIDIPDLWTKILARKRSLKFCVLVIHSELILLLLSLFLFFRRLTCVIMLAIIVQTFFTC